MALSVYTVHLISINCTFVYKLKPIIYKLGTPEYPTASDLRTFLLPDQPRPAPTDPVLPRPTPSGPVPVSRRAAAPPSLPKIIYKSDINIYNTTCYIYNCVCYIYKCVNIIYNEHEISINVYVISINA
jgi:hypothetical protein